MPIKSNQNRRSLLKEQKKQEITALLKERSPMEPSAIIRAISDLNLVTANRYLDELFTTGHIRKVPAPGKRKNIRAYEYRNTYGAKMDIVSVALSHPLHRLGMFMADKK